MVMYEPELLVALQERVGLSEDQARRVLQTIEAVVEEGEAKLASGELFQGTTVSQGTGWRHLPRRLRHHASA